MYSCSPKLGMLRSTCSAAAMQTGDRSVAAVRAAADVVQGGQVEDCGAGG